MAEVPNVGVVCLREWGGNCVCGGQGGRGSGKILGWKKRMKHKEPFKPS